MADFLLIYRSAEASSVAAFATPEMAQQRLPHPKWRSRVCHTRNGAAEYAALDFVDSRA